MCASLRGQIKRRLPPSVVNRILLAFPTLYRSRLVNYETNLSKEGVDDLLAELGSVTPLEGDVIECGSSRCGGTVIMARFLEREGARKRILACDSFEGFDRGELAREREEGLTEASEEAFTSTSFEYVRRKLAVLGVDDVVTPVKGYFEDTLPTIDGRFSFAFVDCDLQESLSYCAETLWPRLVGGGKMLFDDYASPEFRGARAGVDDFVARRGDEIAEHRMLQRLYRVTKR
jgi:hypothetical protein